METKKFTRLSLLLALSVVLNIIETIIPIFNGMIPGVKLGLANTIVLYVLYTYDTKEVYYISILRVVIVGILRTGIFSISFFLSLGGSLLSATIMLMIKKWTKLSILGVSITGSLAHSIGQIIIATFLLENINIIYYLPWILILAIPTGIVVGLISKELLKATENA